jgi:hypothetical protein
VTTLIEKNKKGILIYSSSSRVFHFGLAALILVVVGCHAIRTRTLVHDFPYLLLAILITIWNKQYRLEVDLERNEFRWTQNILWIFAERKLIPFLKVTQIKLIPNMNVTRYDLYPHYFVEILAESPNKIDSLKMDAIKPDARLIFDALKEIFNGRIYFRDEVTPTTPTS